MSGNDVRFRASLDDKVSGSLDKLRDKFDQLGKSKGAQSILQGVGQGLGQAALKRTGDVVDFVTGTIQDSIAAASDLNETMGKVGIVFGAAGKDIDKWGDTAAQSLGLSKQAAEEAAATLGNMFIGAGQTSEQAAGLSKTMVQLAADIGALNNLDTDVALEKLRSGLSGEAEPLRSVGVFLTEAAVKAKAMKMGLGDVHGELTEGEKILARYQLILEQTKTAQGNFADTSDDLAGSQKRANAALKDSEALLGKRLLPVQQKVTDGLIDFATGLSRVLTASDLTTDGLRAQADMLMRVGQALGPLGQSQRDQATALYAGADAADAYADSFDKVTGSSEEARLKILATANAVDGFSEDVGKALGPNGAALTAAKEFGPFVAMSLRQSNDDVFSAADDLLAEMKKPFLDKKKIQDILSGKGSMGKQLIAGLNSQRPNVVEAAQKMRDELIAALDAVVNVEVHPFVGPKSSARHKAAGGPVDAGVPIEVGEFGRERFVPWTDGRIISAGANDGGGGGGGPIQVHTTLMLDGHAIAQAVTEHDYYALSRSSPSSVRK